uniref:Uncharacterized protein n=1 Tax=Rhodnius prolixus TaxID=13249 RepID=T1HK31_RHOPR
MGEAVFGRLTLPLTEVWPCSNNNSNTTNINNRLYDNDENVERPNHQTSPSIIRPVNTITTTNIAASNECPLFEEDYVDEDVYGYCRESTSIVSQGNMNLW